MALEVYDNRQIKLGGATTGRWSTYVTPSYDPSVSTSYSVGDRMLWKDTTVPNPTTKEYVCISSYTSSTGLPDLTKWEVTEPTSLQLTMAGNTPLPIITSKVQETDIPTTDGTIDQSRASGRLRFNKNVITYTFTHTIDRYNSLGKRKSLTEMNQEANQHRMVVEQWAYSAEEYNYNPSGDLLAISEPSKFYDTGIGVPSEIATEKMPKSGYWLPNPRCTNFSFSKTTSSDLWLLQYQIEITTDPYAYEMDANPKTYTMFSGPTSDGYEQNEVAARIFTKPVDSGALVVGPTTPVKRSLWTNDNVNWILSDSAYQRGAGYAAVWTFKPSVRPIYAGDIGVYMNFYVEYTYNDVLYKYHVDTLNVNSGTYTPIVSSKIATANEMGYTNQNGFQIYCTIVDTGTNSLADLITATNGHIPLRFIWGVIKPFYTHNTNTPFMITGKGPASSFHRVTGVNTSETINFGTTFYMDNDDYNEFVMDASSYGFYTLESPDNARRMI